jgi:ubiquinone/menaquinone biosynthesis C-methylase UbiE
MRHGHWYNNDEDRRRWQDPGPILAAIGLASGDTFVDIGCGDGYFAIPAAKTVGTSGRVCGIDISPEALARLKQRADLEGLQNIRYHAGAAEESVLCRGCGDIAFFGISLHDFSDQSLVLANARKMLKPGTGRLVNLDWKKEPMEHGPPFQKRFSEAYAAELIENAGFSVRSITESGPYHYLIIATV